MAQVGYPVGANLDKLFRRTTSDGIAIRGYISRFPSSNNCQGDGWCPPADCYPDASVTGELSTEAAVGIAGGARYGGDAPDLRVSGAGVFGASGEGSPARWTVAQAGADVATVRVSFEGGGTDEMEPVDGVVILAALADVEKAGGTVEALDGDGGVLDEADLTSVPSAQIFASDTPVAVSAEGMVVTEGQPVTSTTVPAGAVAGVAATPPRFVTVGPDPGVNEHCTPPPPSLPEPGEQPGDPAAARAAIEDAFATAYSGGLGSDEAKRDAVEGSEGLTGVMEEIRNGTFAQQVKDATAKVTEIVFTSPTEAAVRYDINVANYSNFTDRIGKALFIDGRWKVARVTVCADISLASGNCPPA
jgi:hypothetical protein